MTFDPTEHLTKVSGRDYLEVRWRVAWLRETHPNATIETDMIQHINGTAVFRATVTLPPVIANTVTGESYDSPARAAATGWGQASRDDFGDYLEKAETNARPSKPASRN